MQDFSAGSQVVNEVVIGTWVSRGGEDAPSAEAWHDSNEYYDCEEWSRLIGIAGTVVKNCLKIAASVLTAEPPYKKQLMCEYLNRMSRSRHHLNNNRGKQPELQQSSRCPTTATLDSEQTLRGCTGLVVVLVLFVGCLAVLAAGGGGGSNSAGFNNPPSAAESEEKPGDEKQQPAQEEQANNCRENKSYGIGDTVPVGDVSYRYTYRYTGAKRVTQLQERPLSHRSTDEGSLHPDHLRLHQQQ